jgi:hypothetical protein
MITLRTHNVIDYVTATVLVLCPLIFGFSQIDAARNLFLVAGVLLAAYSLFTNYYFSIAKIIPVPVHMALDSAEGVLLMIAPSVFGYREQVTGGQYALHFVLGLGLIGLVALTRTGRRDFLITRDRSENLRSLDRAA